MRLCHFDFNYVYFKDQFLIEVTDFHCASSNTAKKKKTRKVIASPERSVSIKIQRKCPRALFTSIKILV